MKNINLLLILLVIYSCSTIKNLDSGTNEFIGYEIIACDSNWVYLKDHPIGRIKNKDHFDYKPGNYLLLPIQFYNK